MPGVIVSPAGETATKVADVANTILTGDYKSAIGLTATGIQLLDSAVNEINNGNQDDAKPKKGS